MVICLGFTHSGNKCQSPFVKNGEKYCRATHDPAYSKNPISNTEIFRVEELRNNNIQIVQEFRSNKDIYSKEKITNIKQHDLDHIFELHMLRDVYDSIPKSGSNFLVKKSNLAKELKSIVNEKQNLGFTMKETNLSKFDACKAFADDFRREAVNDLGFFSYFYEKGMSRKVTKNIQKEMKNSIDYIVQETEDLQYNLDISDKITEMMLSMKLD